MGGKNSYCKTPSFHHPYDIQEQPPYHVNTLLFGMDFQRLIRFKTEYGEIWYGDTGDNTKDFVGTKVPVLTGDPFSWLSNNEEAKTVKEVRIPTGILEAPSNIRDSLLTS